MSHYAVSLFVKGQVQGVFFRASTQSTAEALSLKGWVCNRKDGSVEIHAEGQKKNLDRLIDWCHKGPPAACVKDLVVDWVSPEGLSEFTIRQG